MVAAKATLLITAITTGRDSRFSIRCLGSKGKGWSVFGKACVGGVVLG